MRPTAGTCKYAGIQPAARLNFARLKAAVAGIEGEFQEGHELDAKMAR